MTPELWQSAKDVFARATELPAARREDFVAEACGSNQELRQEITSLLAAYDESDNLLEKHAINLDLELGDQKHDLTYAGRVFGQYRIIREIGSGGMGSVFLAERQDDAYRRQVAIKIIRQTIPDSKLVQRFQQEREILAVLNHPNIATLHDGGISERGEPFFVMEYIEGEPLLEFAKEASLNGRLNLFLKVCSAVAYAHRNLVIHRDIKPSNILVTSDGNPKLLDFGLAKILASGHANQAQMTTAFRAFTPSYASPEQVRGKTVTTATDVYSLGIVLYELLTNQRPFKTEDKSVDEIIREITEHQPTKPSEVLSGNSKPDRFAVQTTRLLKGDLDNIVLMALRKEPERRYSSVEQFAQDIERHLLHLPIKARPNTIQYRASKFIHRNRIAVSAAAVILMVLLAGIGVSLWQYRKAQFEKAKAQEVNAFLKKMLLTSSPSNRSEKQGYSTTINDVLNEATKQLETQDLSGQPEVKAELQSIIGLCYLDQGQYDLGERYLREALAGQTTLFGVNSPKLLETQLALASLYFAKANYDEAERIYRQSLPVARAEYRAGNLDASRILSSLNNYALLRRARGDSKQAEQLFRENLDIRNQQATGAEAGDTTELLLALTQIDQGKFDEAESFARQQVNHLRQSQPGETAALANAQTLLGSVLMEKANLSEAQSELRAAEQIYRKLFSPNAIAIYDNLRLQAQVAYLSGDTGQAGKLVEQVLANYRQNSNPKYINFATALTVQGLVLSKLGKGDAAEKALRDALRLRIENLPPSHFMTALTKGALGEVLTTRAQYAEAETLLRESYDELRASQAIDNQRLVLARDRIAALTAKKDSASR